MADIKNDVSTNLVSVWLSDDSGLTSDLHGSNTLTDNNTVTLLDDGGKNGDAGDFERDNTEYLSITDAAQAGLGNFSGFFSISFWIKPESQPNNNDTIISKWGGSGNEYILFYQDDGGGTKQLRLDWIDDSGVRTSRSLLTQTLSNGTWYHVVLVVDLGASPSVTWYVNNSASTPAMSLTNADDGNVNDSDGDFIIGARGATTPDLPFDGVIHQVAIYNGQLSSSDVSTLYNSGNGIPYEAAATFAGSARRAHLMAM